MFLYSGSTFCYWLMRHSGQARIRHVLQSKIHLGKTQQMDSAYPNKCLLHWTKAQYMQRMVLIVFRKINSWNKLRWISNFSTREFFLSCQEQEGGVKTFIETKIQLITGYCLPQHCFQGIKLDKLSFPLRYLTLLPHLSP